MHLLWSLILHISKKGRLGTGIPLVFLENSFLSLLAIERNCDSQTNSALPRKIFVPLQTGEPPVTTQLGLPRWHSAKESACQCRRCRRRWFDPWVRKIPWSRKWQPTPVFLPGKFHGQRSLAGYSEGVAKSQTQLSVQTRTCLPGCLPVRGVHQLRRKGPL